MKKTLTIVAVFIVAVTTLKAQNAYVGGHQAWTLSVQGGPVYSINENRFAYVEAGKGSKLFSLQGSLSVGHEFSEAFAIRLNLGYGGNRGAGNNRESGNGFYPYNFKSVNGFVDFLFNLKGDYGTAGFHPALYAGVGAGYSFGFSKPAGYGIQPKAGESWKLHPWQDSQIEEKNVAPALHGGFIAEYDFSEKFGIFADLGVEAYRDNYNGLQPSELDHGTDKGYAGFPFDIRLTASMGIIFRFEH